MIPIILCAGESGRCVTYGYVETLPEPGQPVTLRRARRYLRYFGRGLFGQASVGPDPRDRLTHSVDSVVETVWRQYLTVTTEAATALDAHPPWMGGA